MNGTVDDTNFTHISCSLLWGKQHNFGRVDKSCISEGSAVTFITCGGQMHTLMCQLHLGFGVPK